MKYHFDIQHADAVLSRWCSQMFELCRFCGAERGMQGCQIVENDWPPIFCCYDCCAFWLGWAT